MKKLTVKEMSWSTAVEDRPAIDADVTIGDNTRVSQKIEAPR